MDPFSSQWGHELFYEGNATGTESRRSTTLFPFRAREAAFERWRESWLLIAAAISILSGAIWVRSAAWPTLPALALGVVGVATLGWKSRKRAPYLLFVGSGLALFLLATNELRRLQRVSRGDDERAVQAVLELQRVTSLARAGLSSAAESFLTISPVSASRFDDARDRLHDLGDAFGESAVVISDTLGAFAWAGLPRVAPEVLPAGIREGIVRTEFYTLAFGVAERSGRRAVVFRTLHAQPPANRLARDLAALVARRRGVERFEMSAPAGVPHPFFGPLDSLQDAKAVMPAPGAEAVRELERARGQATFLLGIALLVGLGIAWRRPATAVQRAGALLVSVATIAIVPLNSLSNTSALFDPSYYYAAVGGPFTASIGALSLTSGVLLIGLFTLLRAPVWFRSRWIAGLIALACVSLGPYLMRDLARGITLPPRGVSTTLWIAWELGLFLPAAALLLLAVAAGQAARRTSRGLPLWLGPALAGLAAALAPILWEAPGRFPSYYVFIWSTAMAVAVLARRVRGAVLHGALVAAFGATTLVWSSVSRGRVVLAERDVAGVTAADAETQRLLERLLARATSTSPAASRSDLLKLYDNSEIAAAGNPVELALWRARDTMPYAELVIADLRQRPEGERGMVEEVFASRVPMLREFSSVQGAQLVVATPLSSGEVFVAVAAPRTRLIADDPFAALLGLDAPSVVEPPYRLNLSGAPHSDEPTGRWRRRDDQLHGDWALVSAFGPLRAHVEVDLRSLEALAPRGALLVLGDLAVLSLLWLVAATSDGALRRWMLARARRWRQSYRAQLTVALFAAFVLPAAAFSVWTYRRLKDEDRLSRSLLVQETLRAVGTPETPEDVAAQGARLATPLLLYKDGRLIAESDSLYRALAPLGLYLDTDVGRDVSLASEPSATQRVSLAGVSTLLGYRSLDGGRVLAAPARRSEFELERQQRDLLVLLSVAAAFGALVALWISGLAARAFARPIGQMQRAAKEVATGARELRSLGESPPSEFRPVFASIRRMAVDLADSRDELGRAQRVLAWGEMARQIAHEIKNPLTPIRLGVQHLRRAHVDKRDDFDAILTRNVDRILHEIDRLDEISRSFAKFGTGAASTPLDERVDVTKIAHDVLELERLGESGVVWECEDVEAHFARCREAELREVLLNVLENARLAGATRVRVNVTREGASVVLRVVDDGTGVSDEILPSVFEPRFSTRTSGSGLGLAISKRLVESWGGAIRLRAGTDRGTVVEIELVPSVA